MVHERYCEGSDRRARIYCSNIRVRFFSSGNNGRDNKLPTEVQHTQTHTHTPMICICILYFTRVCIGRVYDDGRRHIYIYKNMPCDVGRYLYIYIMLCCCTDIYLLVMSPQPLWCPADRQKPRRHGVSSPRANNIAPG